MSEEYFFVAHGTRGSDHMDTFALTSLLHVRKKVFERIFIMTNI